MSQPVYHPDGKRLFLIELVCEQEHSAAWLELVEVRLDSAARRTIARFLIARGSDSKVAGSIVKTCQLAISASGMHMAFHWLSGSRGRAVVLVDLEDQRVEAIVLGAQQPSFLPGKEKLVVLARVGNHSEVTVLAPRVADSREGLIDLTETKPADAGFGAYAVVLIRPGGKGKAGFTTRVVHSMDQSLGDSPDLAISEDGSRGAIGTSSGVIVLGPGLEEVHRYLEGDSIGECVLLATDNLLLALRGKEGALVQVDLSTGQTMNLWDDALLPLACLGRSPDGRTLAALTAPGGAGPLVWLMDLDNRTVRIVPSDGPLGIEALSRLVADRQFRHAKPATRAALRGALARVVEMVARLPETERTDLEEKIAGVRAKLGASPPVIR